MSLASQVLLLATRIGQEIKGLSVAQLWSADMNTATQLGWWVTSGGLANEPGTGAALFQVFENFAGDVGQIYYAIDGHISMRFYTGSWGSWSTFIPGSEVIDSIADADTTHAPSRNAVFDALAGKQPLDSDLTALAALTATTDNMVQSVAGAWASRTPAQVKAALAIPYDFYLRPFADGSVRVASSSGDMAYGLKVVRAFQIASVTYRVRTADASGNLVVELRKNGTQQASTVDTIAAASQVAGHQITGLSVSFAAGDVLLPVITGVGTTPGFGLDVIIEAKLL